MNTGRKLIFFISSLLILFALSVMVNMAINFRDYAYKNFLEKARITADIVRDGLTAYMVNNMMDKRLTFLHSISSSKDVKKLWVIRSQNVIKQYGSGFGSEKPRDEIDREVLKTGKMQYKIIENRNEAILRITIPYIASAYNEPNCLSCHNVKEGETLGAISLEFDIEDVRREGIATIFKILAITIIFIVIAIVVVKLQFKPYLKFFEDLKESLQMARSGDFSYKIKTNINTKDIKSVANHYNQLIEKFHNTIGAIEKKLSTLFRNGHTDCTDPLEQYADIIDLLSKIHQFKHTIELDKNIEQIYYRIATVIKDTLGIENYVIYNIRVKDKKREIIYSSIERTKSVCSELTLEDCNKCRAFRTMNVVASDQFPELCEFYCGDFKYYYCIPYQIDETCSIVVMLLTNSQEEFEYIKNQNNTINYYLENAKPVIVSKLLNQKLHEKSIRDGLTGVYNRKFLEEFLDNENSKDSTSEYGVLMLDIDFFKKVNDAYGHDVGDKFIKMLADTITSIVRGSDIVARYGGEEFVVLLPRSSEEGTKKVAENLRKTFAEKSIFINGEQVKKSVSIGISFFPKDASTLREAIKYADIALYKAKESGRNRVVIFEKSMYNENSY